MKINFLIVAFVSMIAMVSCASGSIELDPAFAGKSFNSPVYVTEPGPAVTDTSAMANNPMAQLGYAKLAKDYVDKVYAEVKLRPIIMNALQNQGGKFGETLTFQIKNNGLEKLILEKQTVDESKQKETRIADYKLSAAKKDIGADYLLEYKIVNWGHFPGSGQQAYLAYQATLYDINSDRIIWRLLDREQKSYGMSVSASDLNTKMIEEMMDTLVKKSFAEIESEFTKK